VLAAGEGGECGGGRMDGWIGGAETAVGGWGSRRGRRARF